MTNNEIIGGMTKDDVELLTFIKEDALDTLCQHYSCAGECRSASPEFCNEKCLIGRSIQLVGRLLAENFSITCYDTKEEAEVRIKELEKAPYSLRRGEAGRPSLSAKQGICEGKRKWFIYAEWKFYEGTFYVPKDGHFERDKV